MGFTVFEQEMVLGFALAGFALPLGNELLQVVWILVCYCVHVGLVASWDVLTHFLCCPILWCLAREVSGISETDVSIISRLSIQDPSKDKLALLAYCHVLYHCAVNDRELSFMLMTISPACNFKLLAWFVRSSICFRSTRLLNFVCLSDYTWTKYVPGGQKYII
jgi:hypothetical protein